MEVAHGMPGSHFPPRPWDTGTGATGEKGSWRPGAVESQPGHSTGYPRPLHLPYGGHFQQASHHAVGFGRHCS